MISKTEFCRINAQRNPPLQSFASPEFVPLQRFIRRTEKFHFHLFKFTGPENEVSRSHFIAETFSNLRDAKWNTHALRIDNVFKLEENTLRSFRPKIRLVRLFTNGARIRI